MEIVVIKQIRHCFCFCYVDQQFLPLSAYKFTTVFASSTSEGDFDADDINSSIHGDLA